MDSVREVMAVRYRELYGTTLGDTNSVVRVDLGQGEQGRAVAMYFWSLPAERRLPLRAYVAGFTLKNGVPINATLKRLVCVNGSRWASTLSTRIGKARRRGFMRRHCARCVR